MKITRNLILFCQNRICFKEVSIMDLQQDIQNCEGIIYEGYKKSNNNGISWLNKFCGNFVILCNKIQSIISSGELEEDITDLIFLALTQAITGIKFLEKVLKLEDIKGISLNATREHFLDRILWCLARIKSVLSCLQDDVSGTAKEVNVTDLLDNILEMLEPFTKYNKIGGSSLERSNKQLSENIRSSVNLMLSQVLAFANVALDQDKKAITALCQKVLRECIALQEQCSLDQSESSNLNFQADLLESALLQLEECINESLLRIVYKVFAEYSQSPLDELRTAITKKSMNTSAIDMKIADFDINLDRLIQIGIFAVSFASSAKVRTTIRSCLASLESLDSCLIPSIYSDNLHSILLEEHYHKEMKLFIKTVQKIIDSIGFTTCYIDILSDGVKIIEKQFDKKQLGELLEMGKILKEHFDINSEDLQLNETESKKSQYKNVILMIDECQAVLNCADQIESSRILKRFKILRAVILKLKLLFDNNSEKKDKSTKNKNIFPDSTEDTMEKIFETYQITPTKTTIFYKNRTLTDSSKGNFSKLPPKINQRSSLKVKRNVSLRTAMFKRQKSAENQSFYSIYKENSTSLQITDILDQITNLSKTQILTRIN